MRVRVHLNLQRGDWSITDPKTGRVTASATDVTLRGVTFYVSEATRRRVIDKTRRRVHAWAIGELVATDSQPSTEGLTGVTYNPYRAGTFTTFDGTPVTEAAEMRFVGRFGWMS